MPSNFVATNNNSNRGPSISSLGIRVPGMNTPNSSINIPSLGIHLPGFQSPNIGNQNPNAGNQNPNLGNQMPSLGIQLPSLGIQLPNNIPTSPVPSPQQLSVPRTSLRTSSELKVTSAVAIATNPNKNITAIDHLRSSKSHNRKVFDNALQRAQQEFKGNAHALTFIQNMLSGLEEELHFDNETELGTQAIQDSKYWNLR